MLAVLFENFLKRKVLAVQEFTNLLAGSFERAFSPPHYVIDTLVQMDIIGFGSLPIVLLTGFFTGAVLALQTYRTLSTFGEVGLLGEVDRKSTRLNSSHGYISYAVFCLKKKKPTATSISAVSSP